MSSTSNKVLYWPKLFEGVMHIGYRKHRALHRRGNGYAGHGNGSRNFTDGGQGWGKGPNYGYGGPDDDF
jgi:hypothetical protein